VEKKKGKGGREKRTRYGVTLLKKSKVSKTTSVDEGGQQKKKHTKNAGGIGGPGRGREGRKEARRYKKMQGNLRRKRQGQQRRKTGNATLVSATPRSTGDQKSERVEGKGTVRGGTEREGRKTEEERQISLSKIYCWD